MSSYSEIARLAGTSPAWIAGIMKLADLPVPEQEGGLSDKFSLTPACRSVAAP